MSHLLPRRLPSIVNRKCFNTIHRSYMRPLLQIIAIRLHNIVNHLSDTIVGRIATKHQPLLVIHAVQSTLGCTLTYTLSRKGSHTLSRAYLGLIHVLLNLPLVPYSCRGLHIRSMHVNKRTQQYIVDSSHSRTAARKHPSKQLHPPHNTMNGHREMVV